jgi:hypothetical protein
MARDSAGGGLMVVEEVGNQLYGGQASLRIWNKVYVKRSANATRKVVKTNKMEKSPTSGILMASENRLPAQVHLDPFVPLYSETVLTTKNDRT